MNELHKLATWNEDFNVEEESNVPKLVQEAIASAKRTHLTLPLLDRDSAKSTPRFILASSVGIEEQAKTDVGNVKDYVTFGLLVKGKNEALGSRNR